MATLYVENVPDDLYEALRARAKAGRRSIAQETIAVIQQAVPTPAELARRRKLTQKLLRIQAQKSPGPGPFQSAEEMVRELRDS